MNEIRALAGLNENENAAVASLLKICERADSVPVPLQSDKALNRYPYMNSWFLAYSGETLTGVLSVFNPLADEAEFTGCVHPQHRRQGVFSGLLSEAIREIKAFGITRILYTVDRRSVSGAALLRQRGCRPDHTEYSMKFHSPGTLGAVPQQVQLVRISQPELEEFAEISAAAFEEPLETSLEILRNGFKTPEREYYAAYWENRMVAGASLLLDNRKAMIHGLSVRPQDQGHGYGTDFMAQLVRLLLARQLEVHLDVDSANARAYSLYKRLGFVETDIQDFYKELL